MDDVIFSVGDIIKDAIKDTRYRIINISKGMVELCHMDITKLEIVDYEKKVLISMLKDGMIVKEEEKSFLFDKTTLTDKTRNKYEQKSKMMREVITVYSDSFIELGGHSFKPQISEIMEKYSVPRNSFWRICTKYFQSGMKEYSLVDAKAFGPNRGKTYSYGSKPGKKAEEGIVTGVIVTDEITEIFQEALEDYKSGRAKTVRATYDRMNWTHFTHEVIKDGVKCVELLPISQRPTIRQLRYFINKNLTKEEKDIIKTSVQENRNDKRLLLGDSLDGVSGPGDMVEIDACEADVSLVSVSNRNKCIGRPIVYFMIDVFSRIILAVAVSFDNNSVLGFTNLFFNLADDKREYCRRYGIDFDSYRIWPSNIIPRRFRTDRGSEFKSKAVDRICNDLGIEKEIVTGGSGSLKGIVEQSFHQMHVAQNVHLEKQGLIEKRYDSKHHEESTLNIYQYTQMVINFVLDHNQRYFKGYHLTKDMIDKGIQPIPALLWEYGIEKYTSPRPIVEHDLYMYNLMSVVTASLSRRGISYKNLYYLPDDDPVLKREMFDLGKKKKKMEVRIDMRDVGCVYYIRNTTMICAPLNKSIAGNADYDGLTMKEYDDYQRMKKNMDAQGSIHNDELSAYRYAINEGIVDGAKKRSYSEKKNMRPAREKEKQEISIKNRIRERLEDTQVKAFEELSAENIDTEVVENLNAISDTEELSKTLGQNDTEIKSIETKYKSYSNWQEALDDMEDDD